MGISTVLIVKPINFSPRLKIYGFNYRDCRNTDNQLLTMQDCIFTEQKTCSSQNETACVDWYESQNGGNGYNEVRTRKKYHRADESLKGKKNRYMGKYGCNTKRKKIVSI